MRSGKNRIISLGIAAALLFSSSPVAVFADENTEEKLMVKTVDSQTLELAETDVSVDDLTEWSNVQSLIGQYYGSWSAPPTNVVTSNMTQGPILGNGDMAVVMGGDYNSETYYVSKSDFWSYINSDGGDGSPKTVGGIDIKNKNAGSNAGAGEYSAIQDILNAEVRTSLPFGGAPVSTRAWMAPNENVLVVEISPDTPGQSVDIQADIWTKVNTDYITSAGVRDGAVWAARVSPIRGEWVCYAAMGAKVLGAENVSMTSDGTSVSTIEFTVPADGKAYLTVSLEGGKEVGTAIPDALSAAEALDEERVSELDADRAAWWKDYWLKEYVTLDDSQLEEYYYGALYSMGASARTGKTPPGLFGNWITTDSPAWSGDYTLDYNYYGPFNGMSSSNRLDQIYPMFQPILDFIPAGRERAENIKSVNGVEYPNGLPGVQYPTHIGPWGMETYFDCGMKSNAAFAALPFLWYYDYTKDEDFLRDVAYPYLREVVDFWDEYLQINPETGKYTVYESSARESWSGSNDINPVLDVAFVTRIYQEIIPMSETLGVDEDRREKWNDILENMSPLPTTEYNGKTVFKEADNRPEMATEGVGDNPVNMQSIYPGGLIGLDSDPELLQTARNSLEVMDSWNQGNAFANIFVMGARVGWPASDLMNKLKERLEMIKAPNLTYQSDGHGLEGAGAIEAINSMLMQSTEGVLRFFPVWPADHEANFTRMRAVGAFLVNAAQKDGVTQYAEIYSEKGETCTVENPWDGKRLLVYSDGEEVAAVADGDRYTFNTEAGKTYTLEPQGGLPEPPEYTEEPIASSQEQPLTLPDVAYWRLDDTENNIAVDSSGNGYDAPIINATAAEGYKGGALEFNGRNSYVLLGDYEKPKYTATYSAWVKADSLTEWGTVIKNWGGNNKGQMQLGLNYQSGQLCIIAAQANGNEVSCTESAVFPTGVWQHVAAVADGSRIRLYRNGIEVANTKYNGTLKTDFAPLGIGAKPNDTGTGYQEGSAGFWDGMIDDVRIYSKALSASDIESLATGRRFSSEYKEDFEKLSVLTDVMSGADGWELTGDPDKMIVQRGSDLGISSNSIRFGTGSSWGDDLQLALNINENAKSKLVSKGADESEAEAAVSELLGNDMSFRFKAYFKCDDAESTGAYYYIKLRDSNDTPFATLKLTVDMSGNSTLSLIALSEDGNENVEYEILRANSRIFQQMTTFDFEFDRQNNKYKLSINGTDVETPGGSWFSPSSSDAVGSASEAQFGELMLSRIEFICEDGGWWQVITLDDFEIRVPDESRIIDASVKDAVWSDGVCETTIQLVNGGLEDRSGQAVIAVYDANDSLIGSYIADAAVEAGDGIEITQNIDCAAEPEKVKVFIWDSVDAQRPLSPIVDVFEI